MDGAGEDTENIKAAATDVGDEPGSPGSTHGKVFCRFNIFNIREINIKTQSISVDFYFEATWAMPDLVTDEGELKQVGEVDWTSVWVPKIVFANKLGDLQVNEWYAVDPSYVEKLGGPMASYRAKVSGEFTQLLNLHKFPYDTHSIELLLSTDHLTTICRLEPNLVVPSGAQVARFSVRDQWDLMFDPKTSVKALAERKGAGGAYSQLSLCIPCTRNPIYHLANTMLLMFLVVMLFFIAVFGAPRSEIANRMEIASNSVLTAVALKLLSAEQLPDLPYMTFLDKYMLGSIFLLVGLVTFCFLCELVETRTTLGDQECGVQDFFEDCLMNQIDTSVGNVGLISWCVCNFPLFKPLCCRKRSATKGAAPPVSSKHRFTLSRFTTRGFTKAFSTSSK
jgi:hypothetical protein